MPKTKRDYYEVLGVGRQASLDEIKQAYRRLAKEYHPDRNPDNRAEAEERFKELSEAYEVLANAEKRRLYDLRGHEGVSQQFGPGGFDFGRDFTHVDDLTDLFGDLFGGRAGRSAAGGLFDLLFSGGGRRRRAARGGDIRIRMRLTLEEIASGVTREVTFSRFEVCAECQGRGGKGTMACPTCGGSGQVRRQSSSFFGQFVQVVPCPDCGGEGSRVMGPCDKCRGDGRVRQQRTLKVRIPAGVASGNFIPLHDEGHYGPGGRGDLLIEIEEKEHPLFVRHGDDLVVEVPVSYAQAALGGKIEVPTLNGSKRIALPAGIQSGKVIRVKGAGIRHLDGGKGDELVRVIVHVPGKVGKGETELLKKLESVSAETLPSPRRPA